MSVKVHVSYTGPKNESWEKDLKVKSFLYKNGSYNVTINKTAEKTTVVASRVKTPQKTYSLTIEDKKVSRVKHNLKDQAAFKIEDVFECMKWGKDLGLKKIGKKYTPQSGSFNINQMKSHLR